MTVTLQEEPRRLVIKFNFARHRWLPAKLKRLDQWKYFSGDRVWTAQVSAKNLRQLKGLGFSLSPALEKLL